MKNKLNFACFVSFVPKWVVALGAVFWVGCQSSSDGEFKGAREVEAKHLARLDDRPANGGQVLTIDSPDWGTALYYALKRTSRNLNDDDFNASTYQVANDVTTILPSAFEEEPFTGRVVVKHENGKPRLMAYMRSGILVKTGTITDEEGQKRTAIDYDSSGRPVQTREWDANGTLISTVDHQPTTTTTNTPPVAPANPNLPAEYKEFDAVEVRGWLVYEKTDMFFAYTGALVAFHDADRKNLARVEHYVDGKPEGKATWWHANGQKHYEATYADGEPEGLITWWRSDGSTEHEAFWQDGKLARATTWDADNQENGKVLNGNGTLLWLHPDGAKRMEAIYTDGKLSDENWWDKDGNTLPKVPTFYRVERPRITPTTPAP